ncbi:MAG: Rieske (2Fe-2S) protein [Dehalococcoidia bacterium]|nr:MAG: Rieske (2Fe-2S) protein [Dehalococcoidia bacterium]
MAEYTVKTGEMKDGEMRAANIGGREVLVARVAGQFYAARNVCPHLGGRLADGTLEGTIVTCPRHGSRFDLSDGRVVRWTNWSGPMLALGKLLRSPRPLKTYQVKIEGDTVKLEV